MKKEYTVQEAAAAAGVSVAAIYQAVRELRLKATKRRGRWFVHGDSLAVYAAGRTNVK